MLAPIALFVYNRPEYLKKTLRSLSLNVLAKESTLIIYADGPKSTATPKELRKIQEVKNIINDIKGFNDVQVYFSESNQGLANSIIAGVTKTIEDFGKVIVLEDDLEFGTHFLQFMNDALEVYSEEKEVICICGHNYPLPLSPKLPTTFFHQRTDSYGWATWKRAWNLFEPDASKLLQKIQSQNLEFDFDCQGSYPFTKMLANCAQGNISSWAIRWYASSFVNNGLTLYPYQSLVRHIGHVGTHFKVNNSDILGYEISNKKIFIEKIPVLRNQQISNIIIEHLSKFDRRKLTFRTFLYYLKRLFAEIKFRLS